MGFSIMASQRGHISCTLFVVNLLKATTLNSTPNKTLGSETQCETFRLLWDLHYKFSQKIETLEMLISICLSCPLLGLGIHRDKEIKVKWNFLTLFKPCKDSTPQTTNTIFIDSTSAIRVAFLSTLQHWELIVLYYKPYGSVEFSLFDIPDIVGCISVVFIAVTVSEMLNNIYSFVSIPQANRTTMMWILQEILCSK